MGAVQDGDAGWRTKGEGAEGGLDARLGRWPPVWSSPVMPHPSLVTSSTSASLSFLSQLWKASPHRRRGEKRTLSNGNHCCGPGRDLLSGYSSVPAHKPDSTITRMIPCPGTPVSYSLKDRWTGTHILAKESRKPPRDRTRPSTVCFEMFLPETGPLSGYRQMGDIVKKVGSPEGLRLH